MEWKTIRYERDGSVVRLTLNRPEAYNALSSQMIEDLFAVISEIEAETDVRAVLLTGAGRAFCAGGDVREFHEHIATVPKLLKRMTTPLHAAISRMMRMEKPVVAAVNGVAAGAGMALVMAADLAVAAASARFTMAYTGIGATPDGSSTFFLPRLVGLRRAMELVLENRTLSAEEALAWGLLNRVVPDAEVVAEAEALARRLAAGPTRAFGGAKRLLHLSFQNSPETHMEEETQSIAAMGATADFREGVAAFVAKRPAAFEGR